MSNLFEQLTDKIKAENKFIVFPEGLDERVLTAASQLSASGILTPILLGDKHTIKQNAAKADVDVTSCKIIDPKNFPEFELMVETFVERRKGKVTAEEAREILLDENYFGTMLVHMNQADGLVSGAAHSTADTVRPALQIIKTKEGIKKTSGVFIMVRNDEKYVFADCAININPDSQDLAEIAVESANTAKLFDVDPRIAMLSFSTKGSAKSEETEKVVDALKLTKEKNPSLLIDGEFQFDAAFVPSVAAKKAPDSVLQGDANVFIFPSLEAGNIGYKIAQRLGEFEAVGPILQGLNKPVNDLSRGCSSDDVYKLALITAAQA
ncbi:phosphate acetyltransferase [Virgibacillus doumboii]|uniref:phosphate acetyltransferase n=1 Tax=Virgibacillus doumboii TaxID=2697503 RepID=UPI0013DFE7BB|nr:phosphate acetyltransferase [Virgibacillus doumboii]